ncbi:MAG TPA: zinc ribbon domain-containing protein [Bryobacteraceae bacterium]|nr:zinc ribbon domain-containing protein [Bryobacteraceae bacterium]
MFTWICPQCGREVPPAYNECPDCAGKPAGAQPVQQPPRTAGAPQYPPQPQYAPQQPPYQAQPQYPPQQPQYPQPLYPSQTQFSPPPPVYQVPPPKQGLNIPPWLMSIGFAIIFLGIFAGAYFGVRHFTSAADTPANAAPAADKPAAAGSGQASTLQKYVEVIGVRILEDSKKKPQVRFVVVNHSGAEMSDLTANVNLWARTAKSDEEAVGTFSFKLPSLGAYESKELSAPLNTKLKVYELPDWQNLTAEVQVTSPQ